MAKRSNVIIAFYCDVWRSHNSMCFAGVFSNKKKFYSAIKKMVKDKSILLVNGEIKNFMEWTLKEINNNFNYLYVEEVNFNELQ